MPPSRRTELNFDESVLREITRAANIAPWELIEMFIDDAKQSVATIMQTSAVTDPELVNRTAHTLKSSAGSVGAMCVAEIAKELEAATKPSLAAINPNACAALSDELGRAFEIFRQTVEADRERLSA